MRTVIKAVALAVGMAMMAGAGAEEAGKREGSFVVHKLSDWLYAIGEPDYYQKNYSYLLLGNERALMFDAGANQKEDITKVAATLTDKPLSVLPSHLHFDHLGGLHNFSSVYLVDIPFTRTFKRDDGLYHVPEPVYLGNFDHMTVKPFKVDRLVKPGELIDLGGLQVRLLNTPGHTKDEVVLYDETHNVLLSGDHLYPSWLLAGNLKDYIASLDATLKLINPQTAIYGAHADENASRVPAMTYAEVGKIREQMLAIQAGRAKGEKFSDPELIKQANLYKVEKDISILTDIEFTDGRAYGYNP